MNQMEEEKRPFYFQSGVYALVEKDMSAYMPFGGSMTMSGGHPKEEVEVGEKFFMWLDVRGKSPILYTHSEPFRTDQYAGIDWRSTWRLISSKESSVLKRFIDAKKGQEKKARLDELADSVFRNSELDKEFKDAFRKQLMHLVRIPYYQRKLEQIARAELRTAGKVESGKEVLRQAQDDVVSDIKRLLSRSELRGKITISRPVELEVKEKILRHKDAVRSVAFSPDSRKIVTGSDDGTARVWDVKTGEEKFVLQGHTDRVLSVAFSPDGRKIVTGSDDRTARVWDIKTGEEKFVLQGHTDWVRSVAFSPDSRSIVTGSDDRTARVWDVGDLSSSGTPRAELRSELPEPRAEVRSDINVDRYTDKKELGEAMAPYIAEVTAGLKRLGTQEASKEAIGIITSGFTSDPKAAIHLISQQKTTDEIAYITGDEMYRAIANAQSIRDAKQLAKAVLARWGIAVRSELRSPFTATVRMASNQPIIWKKEDWKTIGPLQFHLKYTPIVTPGLISIEVAISPEQMQKAFGKGVDSIEIQKLELPKRSEKSEPQQDTVRPELRRNLVNSGTAVGSLEAPRKLRFAPAAPWTADRGLSTPNREAFENLFEGISLPAPVTWDKRTFSLDPIGIQEESAYVFTADFVFAQNSPGLILIPAVYGDAPVVIQVQNAAQEAVVEVFNQELQDRGYQTYSIAWNAGEAAEKLTAAVNKFNSARGRSRELSKAVFAKDKTTFVRELMKAANLNERDIHVVTFKMFQWMTQQAQVTSDTLSAFSARLRALGAAAKSA